MNSFQLKAQRQLLRSLPTELRNMLPVTGSKEWLGVARTLRYIVTSRHGGAVKTVTLTLDIPTSGMSRRTRSSSSRTLPEVKAQTTGRKSQADIELEELEWYNRPAYP